tara:strand:- start:132 stop:440 length:309 start_codon:yes stop_codon:yes gene_type:complete
MTKRLDGKHALTTSGNRGIGKAIAEVFASEGCNLTLVGRPGRVKKTETEIHSQHAITVFPVLCDVVNQDHVENMVSDAETKDSIDILINNTGSHGASSFLHY